MKIEISCLVSLFLIVATLVTRATFLGIGQALLATAIEYGPGGPKLLSSVTGRRR